QRPLVAYHEPARGAAAVLPEAPLGYLTAYPAEKPDLVRPVELWPRLLRRPPYLAALELFRRPRDPHPHRTALGVCLLLDAWNLVSRQPLSRSFATRILPGHNHHTIDDWLAALPQRAADVHGTLPPAGLVEELEACLEPSDCGLRIADCGLAG